MIRAAACLVFVLSASAEVGFNRDVRPIMADTCFRCHGPDSKGRMANLRLDVRDEATKKTARGTVPIVPGDPDKSEIIKRIFATNALVMPPKNAHKDLTDAQKKTIRQWVAEGAHYEGHWAYNPILRAQAPEKADEAWTVRNDIDLFIQQRLKQEGLKPSPEADKRTLIRRVTLDLTGLPPSSRDVAAFLSDPGPDAYARVVDRLLGSRAYAEKQTQLWLDAVRYSDTCGFHGDNPFPAWPYRDYVLRSFLEDKPFNIFTREQLAGDLIPGATVEQKVASAFNRMNRTSAEGGLQPKEYLAKYAADRVRTTAAVWLGATFGCAECHDHKFDPIKARDFYSLKAFFADIQETGLVPDRGDDAWGTQVTVPSEEQAERLKGLTAKLAEVVQKLEAAQPSATDEDWTARFEAGETSWRYPAPLTAKAKNGAVLTIHKDEPVESFFEFRGSLVTETKPMPGLITASGPNPDNETYTVTLKPDAGELTAVGIEIVQDETLPGLRMARGADRLAISEIEAWFSPDGRTAAKRVPIALATSANNYPTPGLPAMAAIDGDPKTAWGTQSPGERNNLFLALRFAAPVKSTAQSVLTVVVRHDSEARRAVAGRFRIAVSGAKYAWPRADTIGAHEPEKKLSGKPAKVGPEHLRWASPELEPLVIEQAKLDAEIGLLKSEIPVVVTTVAAQPEITRVLPRGNFLDESGEVVQPAIPAFLGKVAEGRRATRLDLADWIVSPDNPLTARVFANRMWRAMFGTGISKVLDDFGSQGEWPTHPELLDYLADEFRSTWSVRGLLRTIVMSHTYRQASLPQADATGKDPYNRLLARQSPVRVDAEQVRDIALTLSGLRSEKFGGPSARPVQPDGYLAALNFPKRDYSASRGEDLYRRGIYTHWQRTFLHPSLAAFDAPTREECTVNRTNSNTPLQALVLLNDPIYVETARVFAQRILAEGGRTVNAQISWAFEQATSRQATDEEIKVLAGLHAASVAEFRKAPKSATAFVRTAGEAARVPSQADSSLAAMTTVARAILNLHETITRN